MSNMYNKKFECWAENLEILELLIYLKANRIIWSTYDFVNLYQIEKIGRYKQNKELKGGLNESIL